MSTYFTYLMQQIILFFVQRSKTRKHNNIFIHQKSAVDCGPTCLQMVAKFHQLNHSIYFLREISDVNRNGVSLSALEKAAQRLGFRTHVLSVETESLRSIPLPAILHWNGNHFVVLASIDKYYHVLDPEKGILQLDENTFHEYWSINDTKENTGIVMVMTPSDETTQTADDNNKNIEILSLITIFSKKRKRFLFYLSVVMILGTALSMFMPWLWQIFYDVGVESKNTHWLSIIVLSQTCVGSLLIYLTYKQGKTISQISNSISRSLTGSFFKKLVNIPLHIFEYRTTGDLLQSMSDVDRVKDLLGAQCLTLVISVLSSVLFLSFLSYYNWIYASIFIAITVVSFVWFYLLYKSRKLTDYKLFHEKALYQSEVLDIINGLADIKSYSYKQKKLHRWNMRFSRVYKLERKLTVIGLKQRSGFRFFHTLKDAVIFYLAGTAVIHGEISTGLLLSLSYILQQINAPLEDLLLLFDELQDSTISMERLKDIFGEREEAEHNAGLPVGELSLKNVSFKFPGSPFSLTNINIRIPAGKLTAITGASGCGKSTLLKMISGHHPVQQGQILIGDTNVAGELSSLMPVFSAFVRQDGYIFSDSIKENIIMDAQWDLDWFQEVMEICALNEWVRSLPQQEHMIIGHGGIPVSGGQKQRILLARAIYKRPKFLFLDEAFSALDIKTEQYINNRLSCFTATYQCTTITITHRLDAIKDAHQIIVLENGTVSEKGSHNELISLQNNYSGFVGQIITGEL